MSQPIVPLVNSAPLSPFGDLTEVAAPYDSSGLDRDGTYVPGFSEMRRERDIAMGRYVKGEIRGQDVPVLPCNLRWARTQNFKGDPDGTKSFHHGRRNWRFITKDDLGKPYLLREPAGCTWNAAGQLCNGDTALMYCSKEDSARNLRDQQFRTAERVNGMTGAFAAHLQKDGVTAKGVDPTITKLPSGQQTRS